MLIYLLWKYWQVNGAHYSIVHREVFVRGVFRYDSKVVVHVLFIIQDYSSLFLFIILGTPVCFRTFLLCFIHKFFPLRC